MFYDQNVKIAGAKPLKPYLTWVFFGTFSFGGGGGGGGGGRGGMTLLLLQFLMIMKLDRGMELDVFYTMVKNCDVAAITLS